MEWILPEWLVALALTLFVVDIFVSTEILSWGGVRVRLRNVDPNTLPLVVFPIFPPPTRAQL